MLLRGAWQTALPIISPLRHGQSVDEIEPTAADGGDRCVSRGAGYADILYLREKQHREVRQADDRSHCSWALRQLDY